MTADRSEHPLPLLFARHHHLSQSFRPRFVADFWRRGAQPKS